MTSPGGNWQTSGDQKSELAQNVEVGEDKAVTEAPPSSSAYAPG